MNQFCLLHTQNIYLFLYLSWTFPLCMNHLAKESVHVSMPFQNLISWISFFVHPSFSVTYFLLIAFVWILIFFLYIFLVMLGLKPALVFYHYSSMPYYSVTYVLVNLSSKAFIVRCIYYFSLILYHLCYFLLHILKISSQLQSVCWYLRWSLSVILLHGVMWPLIDAYPLWHFLFAELQRGKICLQFFLFILSYCKYLYFDYVLCISVHSHTHVSDWNAKTK